MLFRKRFLFAISFLVLSSSACKRSAPPASLNGGESAIPVRVQKPESIRRPVFVEASGTVEADQTVDIGFQVSGRVARVLVEEGQAVRKGQLIAEIEDSDYRNGLQASEGQAGVAQASLEKARNGTRPEEIEQARAAYERAESEYRRYRQLYERQSMAAVDFARVEAGYRTAKAQYEMAQNGARKEDRSAADAAVLQAQAQLRVSQKRAADAGLLSPISGIVARRGVDPGEMASAGLPVFSIVNLNPVRVRAGIPEMDIGRIRVGQRASIAVPALGGNRFQGTVDLVGVSADPNSRTFTAKIIVSNGNLLLKAGMIAEASIEASGTIDSIQIPGEAIVRDPQGGTLVYVYYPDRKRVHARRVEPGAARDRGVEVHSGLAAGELIVVAGQNIVREGSLVEVMP
jgi:multidrug efflux pump subunit AcrA (membrane-fusion protein)